MMLPVIMGPTAVGKTMFAIEVASRADMEIVSADSRQVYRFMDIGTAKPTKDQLGMVKHHMIDFVDPDEHFGAGQYGSNARKAVREIASREKLPLVVGGSGLYIRALVQGFFSAPAVDRRLRERILATAEEKGARFLYERLKTVDREAAERIHPNDLQRISRALEVFEQTKTPISELQKGAKGEGLKPLYIGLARERGQLYGRIESRILKMVQSGFAKEVKRLLDMGYSASLNSFAAVGYREMAAYLSREMSLDEAMAKTVKNTKAFARRQLTWFRSLENVHWINLSSDRDEKNGVDTVTTLISKWCLQGA